MAFTYLGTLATDLDKIRFEIGDVNSGDPLFTDEEIVGKQAGESNHLIVAAQLCDILATKFARDYDFSTDGQSFSRSQRSSAYAARAMDLRARAGGISSNATVKVDGYSDDVPYDESDAPSPARGRVRAGYFDGDVPY